MPKVMDSQVGQPSLPAQSPPYFMYSGVRFTGLLVNEQIIMGTELI